MFRFGKADKHPLADRSAAERWRASASSGDPFAEVASVVDLLSGVDSERVRRTSASLEAVFVVDAAIADARRALSTQYVENSGRSDKIESQLWQGLFDLTHAFLVAYATFARAAEDEDHDPKWKALEVELIARRITHLAWDAKLRTLRYEQWIPGKWLELHSLFALACGRKLERQEVVLDRGAGATTIEQRYLATLMFQLLNTGNLTVGQLEWCWRQVDEWCAPLRLSIEAPGSRCFYVDLGERHGLRRRPPVPLQGRVLFVDTSHLHTLLEHYVNALERKIREQPLSARTARRVDQRNLVARLAAQVDADFRPLDRRSARAPAGGRMDVVVGFGKLLGWLREEERVPIPEIDTGMSFNGTLELAVFGHSRNDDDRRHELARQRVAAFVAPGSPWDVLDASDSGVRLEARLPAAGAAQIGALVGTRAEGELVWRPGVIRRLKRPSADRIEFGIEFIGETAVAIELLPEGMRLPSDAAMPRPPTGEASQPPAPRSMRGLFLVGVDGKRSLILPAGDYPPEQRALLRTREAASPIVLGTTAELQHDWAWVDFSTELADTPR